MTLLRPFSGASGSKRELVVMCACWFPFRIVADRRAPPQPCATEMPPPTSAVKRRVPVG